MKTCTKCEVEKSVESFYPHKIHGLRNDCIVCCKSAVKNYRQTNPIKARNSWRAANNRRYQNAPELFKSQDLKRKYGITLADYQKLEQVQNFVCAICFKPKGKRALAVDHNHTTGKVRGLLCSPCNTGLGQFCDNKALLERASEYLKVSDG